MINLEFIEYLKFLIGDKYFEHFYLVNNVLSVARRNVEPNQAWIIGNERSWVLGFCAEGQYHLYGDNWVDSQIEVFSSKIDFTKIPETFQFSGNRKLIEILIERNETLEFDLFKNRIFYEVESTNPINNPKDLTFRLCEMSDLDEVSKMNCDFFVEEYNGENNKDYEEMRIDMQRHIHSESFYLALRENEILGFCSKLETEFDNPMIGTVFVKAENRNQGIGQYMLKEVSDIILKSNKLCWLMTDEKNKSSNVMVEKIGYRKIYDYSSGTLKQH